MKKIKIFTIMLLAIIVVAVAVPAFAAAGIGWEGETILEKLATSLSGPIAKNISIIALVISIGGLMVMGIDFSSWGSRLCWLFLGISVICFAANWLNKIGVNSALIS